MKKLYFLLVLSFFLSKANAQWVTIPDQNFVNWLTAYIPSCMNGNQLNTNCTYVINTTNLTFWDIDNIMNLSGIEYFVNLKSLTKHGNVTVLPSLPPSLEYLSLNDCSISSWPSIPSGLDTFIIGSSQNIQLPTLPNSLKYLSLLGNYPGYLTTTINSFPDSLKYLAISRTTINSLPVLPGDLKYLYCGFNLQLTVLPSLPQSLRELTIFNLLISSVPTLPDSLEILTCEFTQFTTLPPLPQTLKRLTSSRGQLTSLPSLPNSLKYLKVFKNQLSSLPALPNSLDTIYCYENFISSLPVLPASLRLLDCSLNSINLLPALPNSLKYLALGSNQVSVLPTLPNSLKFLNCSGNPLTSLPMLPDSLESLYCGGNALSILPPLPNILKVLHCAGNVLTSLPVLPDSLNFLWCNMNQLTSLPVLPNKLIELWCSSNQLSILPNLPPGLINLECNYNQLTSLPFLPNSLQKVSCTYNLLTSIPNFPDVLYELHIRNNPDLKCLPKLGKIINEFRYINIGIDCLPNYPVLGSANTNVSPPLTNYSICDIYNINNCDVYWNIRGKVYNDIIFNCQIDTTENKIKNVKVQLFQNGNLVQQVYSNDTGLYVFDTDTGTFTYSMDTTSLPFSVTCPPSGSYVSTLTPIDLYKDSMNFGVLCKSFDLGASYVTQISGQFFPANYATINIGAGDIANNFGLSCAAGIGGSVIVEINGSASFVSSLPGALAPIVNGDSLTYQIPDFGTVNFSTDFQFIIQTDTFAQAGDLICFSVYVFPLVGDLDSTNNLLQHCFTVVNSFDPNDKQVSHSGVLLPDHEWLTYTIRFQNTGTAPAQHIYILDTLDANLDVSTFTLLSYSHDNLTQVIGNVVKFNFPNINLPDSTNNEPNSHGYVQYKIKLKSGLPIGTIISNTAYNFFDFNPPIATNTVQNQIYFLSPTITPNNIMLCPNESDTLWTQVYDSYQWFKDGNLIPGANNQFLVVDYFNDSGSQFMVEVDSAGVIAQSAPVLVDGWAFLPPFVITEGTFTIGSMGEVIICPGDSVYLILGQPYDTNIQWTGNGIAIPGATNDTLIVTQAGLYHVSGAPSQCPNYVQGLFTDIEVIIAPTLSPSIIPNNLILCPNESDTLWTQQFGTYQWYKDGNLIPGATNQYLVVEQFNAGSQFHVVVSEGNCTGSSSQVLVDSWIFLLPYVISEGTFTVGPNGEMMMCPGDTAYLILGQPYDTNIQWTESGNIIPGANNDTLVVTQSGNYHVSGAPSTCPNFIQNLGVTIEVIVQGPPIPVITVNMVGTHLETSPGFVLYEWIHEGNAVGINSNVIPVQGGGMYTVIVTDANGCTAESQPIVISSIIENSVSGVVNVNYNSQSATLQITRSNIESETEIFVLDVIGRLIADEKMARGISELEIKLSNIKLGIYFVNLSEGGSVKFFME